jgi:hypothetical protein
MNFKSKINAVKTTQHNKTNVTHECIINS